MTATLICDKLTVICLRGTNGGAILACLLSDKKTCPKPRNKGHFEWACIENVNEQC